jgi:nucleotide-binding universal stress UspA family protein
MVTFSHVLYPTDLSEASSHAAHYAATIARWYRTKLTVLHVVPALENAGLTDGLHFAGPLVLPPPPDEVEASMRQAVADDIPADLAPEFVTLVANPTRAIVDHAVSSAADLIVMGTHGRSGFSRLVSGSVAEKVLRRAPCPVLTIPPHAPDTPRRAIFKRILCPIDFSPASKQALGFALDLARQSNGKVTLLAVVEWLSESGLGPEAPASASDFVQHLMHESTERLHGLVADESRTWCDIEEIVASGRAHREILRVASEQGSDLIVMGAHGRGLGLAFLGSTTPSVVRAAACPVLVVHG